MMQIDHVLVSAADPRLTAEDWRQRYGLGFYDGGVHPEYGTWNCITPLGDGFIEFVGVADAGRARLSRIGRWVAEHAERPGRIIQWNARPDDLEAVARRLGLAIDAGDRTLPDGSVVRFRHLGIEQGFRDPTLPFYVSWGAGCEPPGRRQVDHDVDVQGIAWLEVVVADSARRRRLEAWLGEPLPQLRVVEGSPEGPRALALATAHGQLVLTGAA
jgi:Glyoxalase-like domain